MYAYKNRFLDIYCTLIGSNMVCPLSIPLLHSTDSHNPVTCHYLNLPFLHLSLPVFQIIDVSRYHAGLLSYLFIVYTFFEDHVGNKYTLVCFYVLSAAIHLITPNVNFLGTGLNAFFWSTKSNNMSFQQYV